jgi:hypothetical protein
MQLHCIVVILVCVYIISNSNQRTGCPRKFFAQNIAFHDIKACCLIAHFHQILLEIGKCIRDSLCKIHLFLILFKFIYKAECEVVLKALSSIRVIIEKHIICCDVLSCSVRLNLGLLTLGFSGYLILKIFHTIVLTPTEPLVVILFI